MVIPNDRLGHDDVRASDLRAFGAPDAEVAVRLLRAHPQGELSDLRTARVNVHTVEVVREYEARNGLPKDIETRVVFGERPACDLAIRALRVGVRLFVDREQEVERVQKEVPAATRWVQHTDVAR